MKRDEKMLKEAQSHIGHIVTYQSDGLKEGVIARANIESVGGEFESVRIYLRGVPFPLAIWYDQVICCSCQRGDCE